MKAARVYKYKINKNASDRNSINPAKPSRGKYHKAGLLDGSAKSGARVWWTGGTLIRKENLKTVDQKPKSLKTSEYKKPSGALKWLKKNRIGRSEETNPINFEKLK